MTLRVALQDTVPDFKSSLCGRNPKNNPGNHRSVKVHCPPGGSTPFEGPSARLGPCKNMTAPRCTNQVSATRRLKPLLEHSGNARDVSHGSPSDCDSLIAASSGMAVSPECLFVPCAGSLARHPCHIAETQLAAFPCFTQPCWLTVRQSNLAKGRICTRKFHLHALTHLRHT